ncbi:hypothetical protein [Protaetiibacter larvae]|uniref:AbiEi antitoxin C-terminal domain-containing protein n=1 Tax=Protaetiibacter larvae TaxID=2592654 RepID=A0A5C1Y843_9MICO|nr:hypothetical protein [Protaetiibacter larvae]QEO10144.1 hypothetical protein FLP23_09055 [Protaetiibacter larvae]
MTPFPLIDGFAEPELQAIRLDGESYLLGDATVPLDIADSPAVRVAAVSDRRSRRLIAAGETAAWVWGASWRVPRRPEYLVELSARWRPAPGDEIDVRESIVHPDDVVRFGTGAVTTPLRTVIDLARFRAEFGPKEAGLVRALARLGAFDADRVIETMDRGRNLAGKRMAADRVRAALAAQPELTR